jgi:hypothetical protein
MKMYIDESGSARVFAVAGYLGTLEKWVAFDDKWNRILMEADHFERESCPDGRRSLRPFHLSDFDNPENTYYKNWTQDRKVALISALIDTINETIDCAFTCLLPLELYEEMVPKGIRHGKTFTYMACLKQVFAKVLEALVRFPQKARTPLFFDRNDEVAGMAIPVMNHILDTYPHFEEILGPFTYDSKTKFLGLQAADILAHEMMKQRDNEVLKNGKRRRSYERLDKRRYLTFEYNRESMNDLMDELYVWAVKQGLIEPDPVVLSYLRSKEKTLPS